jgi:UDP-GlcNAc:undecaprenyl-phosphate/decaprenyl-phosphate GlcNAc-1-phosphate transferase
MFTTLIISSFILTIIFALFSQKIFLKKNMFDKINERSSHNTIATRSGGTAFFGVLSIISIFYYINGITLYDFSILVPLSILFLVGIYDDLFEVDFKLKFIFQIIVAKIIIDNGFIIDNLHGVFGLFEINRILAQIITMFIIVSIINAINFIDGIDGLAISVGLLFIASFEFFSANNSSFYGLSAIAIFSLIPLYYFNFRKTKKIFLGDSGSYLIGGLISVYVLNILSQNYIIKTDFDIHKIIFVISILIYPIVDLIRIFTIRIYNGKSPFLADKSHIHHILNRYYKSHFKTTSLIMIVSSLVIILSQLILNQKLVFLYLI